MLLIINYIFGSSKNITQRKSTHFNDLKLNQHHSTYLQNAYNKYGKDNFEFEILFTCPKEDLIRLEQYHIDNYKPEYNILKIAGNSLGRKMSENQKQIISHVHKGKIISEDMRKHLRDSAINKKPIYQICPTTLNIISEFDSIAAAKKVMNFKGNQISGAVNGKIFTAGGYIWKSKNEYNQGFISNINLKQTKDIPVIQFTLDGQMIKEFNSIKEAYTSLNVKKSSGIGKVCRNEQLTAHGFIWKYKNIKDAN